MGIAPSMKTKTYLLFFLVLFTIPSLHAQLCQGSLGDPIVNITFGAGPNPGPSLSAAATNYIFRSGDCPDDGFYSVVNRTSSCFGNSWHSISSDHTGDANGYFMLVNASQQPSAFYVDTVDVFCNNTTYEFAAWIMNMIRLTTCSSNPIQPNLTFLIERTDGTVLQTFSTGNIPNEPVPAWRQYGFFFTTPADVSRVVVRIINNAPGGCGNDLALDDITFRPCGPLATAAINGFPSNDVDLCEGETGQFSFSSTLSPGFTDPHFQWQRSINGNTWTDIAGANDLSYTADVDATTTAAQYQYRLTISKIENSNTPVCRVASNVLTVRINPNPVLTVSGNGAYCEGENAVLTVRGAKDYSWNGPSGFTSVDSVLNFTGLQTVQSGTYSVEGTTAAGCSAFAQTTLQINPKPVAMAQPSEISICEGNQTTLTASGGTKYQWLPTVFLSSPAADVTLASPTDSIQYMVKVSNSFSCSDTAYVLVNVLKKPVANAGADKYLLLGSTTQLNGTVGGTNVSYTWSPDLFIDDVSTLQPVVNPQADQTYILEVSSNEGCGSVVDSVKVKVFKGIYVPNAFSPNGDGLNDYWNIPGLNVFTDYEILVFNRYGQKVYHSKTITKPWDGRIKGKEQPTGIYPYIIHIRETGTKLTGWVMIVR